MDLVVYQMPHSPYCIPITQALKACGTAFTTVDVSPHTREEVIEASGCTYYQVPMLRHGERIVLESSAESLDIARYIDREFAKGLLFPKRLEAPNLSLTRYIENDLEGAGFKLADPYYVSSLKDPHMRLLVIRHKERKFGRGCVDAWRKSDGQLAAKFDAMLEEFETTLREYPYLLGDHPVYADFALFGVLGNVTYNGWNKLNPLREGILAWRTRLQDFRW